MRPALRVAAFLLICTVAFVYANHVPSVAPATAPPTEFSAERAMAHVRAIAARPHSIGSEEHGRVREYLLGAIGAMGLAPQVQEATAIGTRYAIAGHVKNVVVRVPGTLGGGGGPAVLLMAHYDAVPAAAGAGDNASGTAVLLETLRALRASPPLAHDVIALIADGEEAGLLGAAAFVREHPWAKDVEVTMNFEARGMRGPSLMFETGPGNLDVVRALRRVGGARATSLSTAVYRQLPNDTDLSETARLGKPALNFAFIGDVSRYHTAQDAVEHLDARSVQDHGDAALALTRELAGNPLPRPVTSDAVFFDFPVLGVVVYPEGWAPVFALLILVPFGWLVMTLRRAEPRWLRGLLLGAGGTLVTVACGGALGLFTANALRSLHASLGSGTPSQSGVYVAATALLAFALASAVYSVLRRWSPALPLHAGGLAVFTLLALVTSFAAPGVSFVFTWPALFVAVALARWNWNPAFAEASLWVATLVAVLILLPIMYLMGAVALGLDATGGAVVAIFTTMGAWLLAHVMEAWPERPWRTTLAALAASLVLFAVGAATVRTSERHPVGSSFGYGVDADSNAAYLGLSASRSVLQPLRSQLTDPPVRAPAWFARYFGVTRAAPAPGPIARAQVRVVSDSLSGGERHLTLRVQASPGIRVIGLRADSGRVLGAAFDGRAVDTTGFRNPFRGRWSMEYYAPQDSGFALALRLAPGPLSLSLLSQITGIPRIPGLELPQRPPGVIPIQRGDFTLVHQRLQF